MYGTIIKGIDYLQVYQKKNKVANSLAESRKQFAEIQI